MNKQTLTTVALREVIREEGAKLGIALERLDGRRHWGFVILPNGKTVGTEFWRGMTREQVAGHLKLVLQVL